MARSPVSPPGTLGSSGSTRIGARSGSFRPGFHWERTTKGAGTAGGISPWGFDSGIATRLQVGTNVRRTRASAQYVTTVSDPAATNTFGHRYVFAPLEQTTVGVETRFNVTFSPDLTFELYAQPFVSSGDYFGLMELAAPRRFDFLRYGEDVGTVTRGNDGSFTVDPDGTGSSTFEVSPLDFNFRSLLGNAVLRWQWRPGSTLFLVWQQTRSQRLVPTGGSLEDNVGDFRLGRDTRALFGLKSDNVLTLKVTYWMNP